MFLIDAQNCRSFLLNMCYNEKDYLSVTNISQS